MTYEEYIEAMVARDYTSFQQYHCDAIAEALIAMGFSREEAYQRAITATATEYIVRIERVEEGGQDE